MNDNCNTKQCRIILWSVVNSILTAAYTGAVAWLLFNAGKIFGKANNFLAPLLLLLLLVLSATITGSLILARPVILYLNGLKKEGIKMLLFTVICLFIIALLVLFALIASRQ